MACAAIDAGSRETHEIKRHRPTRNEIGACNTLISFKSFFWSNSKKGFEARPGEVLGLALRNERWNLGLPVLCYKCCDRRRRIIGGAFL